MSFLVPYPRSKNFVERGDILRRIETALGTHQKVVLTGPGSTG